MKNNIYTLTLLLFSITISWSQVGINTSNPSATLDVVGDVKIDDKLYLENPGAKNISQGLKLLANDIDNDVREYDINASKYGPINLVEFRFRDVSSYGILDYDTKIPNDKYLVTVQGYYFVSPGGSTNILLHSNTNDDYIEGLQIYSYKNSATNTWHLKAYAPDTEFRTYSSLSGSFVDTFMDIILTLLIYRNNFIAKELPDVPVDMGGSSWKPLSGPPAGF